LTILNADNNKIHTRQFHTDTLKSTLFLKQNFLLKVFEDEKKYKYQKTLLQRIFELQVNDAFGTTKYSYQWLYFEHSYFANLFKLKDVPNPTDYSLLEAFQHLYQILYQSLILVNNLGYLKDLSAPLPVGSNLIIDLSEATNDCISGHGKNPAELSVGEESDVLDSEAEIYPTLESEAEQAHGFGSHSDAPQVGVGDTHGLQFFACCPESNNISEVPVEVVNGMSRPSDELNGVSGLTTSMQDPQPDIGLQLSELPGTDVPLHQNIEINRIIFLDVLP
jgi:hypothetical protein